MIETLRHQEAFDYYYSLGDKRGYPQVALRFSVSKTSIVKWAKAHNWPGRVQQRDIEIARRIEKKTNTAIVNSKADYRVEIRENLKILKELIRTAILREAPGQPPILNIDVENAKDMAALIGAVEKLMKLDLLLIGEATGRIEEEIIVTVED